MTDTIKDGVLGKRKLNSYTELNLLVTVWSPLETGDGDFECRYLIAGAGDEKIRRSIGLDGIQAVMLAFKKIGSEINIIQEQLNTPFFIGNGDVAEDHGFPTIEGV